MITITNDSKTKRELLFKDLYRSSFPSVAQWIRRMGGDREQAQDIFQDSLLVFYEKTMQGLLKDCENPPAYVLGIAKKLWLKKYHKNKSTVPLSKLEQSISIPTDFYYKDKKQARVLRFLEAAGQKCLEILQSFYYHQIPLPEIARQFGFSNTRSATVQKYKCLEKIRNEVKSKNLSYEDIME